MLYVVSVEEPELFTDAYEDLDYANYVLDGLCEGRDINKLFVGRILAYENPGDIKPVGMRRIIR